MLFWIFMKQGRVREINAASVFAGNPDCWAGSDDGDEPYGLFYVGF